LLGALIGLGLGGVLVDEYGWQAAFWMWIPLGLVVIGLLSRTPEPERGAQDRDFHDDVAAADLDTFAPAGVDLVADLPTALHLPEPTRVGKLDYANATTREVYRELLGIRSMWFAVMAITISQLSLNALGFWGVDFFKQAHGLTAAEAGGWTVLFGAGAGVGIACGGLISDRLLRKGLLNARVFVAAIGCVLSAVFLLPALLVHQLALAGVLFFVGGFFLTLPVAPSEALMADVVVAQLRGRAGTMRSVVRSASALGPLIVGVVSDATTLRTALALLTPVYVVGGALMVRAARTYPADLAFAVAESNRTRSDR
jgi:predicted MFS family arabinose efflux permease